MGSPLSILAILLLALAGVVATILLIAFVLVPILKVIGWSIVAVFRGIAWIIRHLFEFVVGMLGDAVRFVGAILATVVLIPLMLISVIFGRWSAATHYADSVVREGKVGGGCLYRVALRRPLRLLLLDGLLEGIEQRVPAAVAAAPTSDTPSRRTGTFDGYRIVGSLRAGGSGAKLYVARPDARKRSQIPALPDEVVIKSFAITDGSSLPQIIRESRALEAAKQLGLVLDHGMEEHRFHYVMPYLQGENLGIVTRQLHGAAGGSGLGEQQLHQVMSYGTDLLTTLSMYHRGGLWHKDVKPDNLIVSQGQAHLVDLGLVTPLRSAMTLTTHGTEYFRDPEMVRMALRGVKVHQVDGAKFDVYAAGAVLYFMLENTFPAHGGLSTFNKTSPESLRWIVRRAMAEYGKRYETADTMLADLQYVLNAPNAVAVRPADLPSMRMTPGAAPAEAHAGPAAPPVPPPAAPIPAAPQPVTIGPEGARPDLRVTNWWTGAYVMKNGGTPEPPPAAAAYVRTPRDGGHGRSAAEQLDAARTRARKMRERARERVARHVSNAPSRPSKAVFALTALFVVLLLAAIAAILLSVDGRRSRASAVVTHSGGGHSMAGAADVVNGIRLALVNNHDAASHKDVLAAIEKATQRYERQGYVVCDREIEAIAEMTELMPLWNDDKASHDDAIEDLLEAANFYGMLWVTNGSGRGPVHDRVDTTLIRSEREGARERRGTCASAPVVATAPSSAGLRVALVNALIDPANPEVMDRVAAIVSRHEQQGYVVCDDDLGVIADLARFAPLWTEDPARYDAKIEDILEEGNYYGFIFLSTSPGKGASADRIGSTLIHAERDGATDRRGVCGGSIDASHAMAPMPPAPPAAPAAPAVESDAAGDAHGIRVALVNAHIDPAHPTVMDRVDKVAATYESQGYVVCDDDLDAIAELMELMPLWEEDKHQYDAEVEEVLKEANYYGLLWITTEPGKGPAAKRVSTTLIRSDHKDAKKRTGTCPPRLEGAVNAGVRSIGRVAISTGGCGEADDAGCGDPDPACGESEPEIQLVGGGIVDR